MKQIVVSKGAPSALGPYSHAVVTSNYVLTSGQIGINPMSGNMEVGIEAQTRQALSNICAVLESAGSKLENVIKSTIFLKDIQDFERMNQVYGQFFKEAYPARSAVQIAKLPKDALVEIEVIAHL